MKNVLTHSGTGIEIVQTIAQTLGFNLTVITRPHQLKGQKYDGVLLLGGTDINPFYYGEGLGHSQTPNSGRDYIEWLMVRNAMSNHKTVMGICRGCQMIAIAHGGSLYQDMIKQRQSHYHPSEHTIYPRGPLSDHIPSSTVNSYHHQSIRTVPDGFKTLAKSEDGIIESIWKPGILGVQWHPELMFPMDYRWISLFKWFVSGLK